MNEKLNSSLLSTLQIALKWEKYRDTVKRFYLIDKEKGEQDYVDRMKLLQTIINAYASKHNLEVVGAIIALTENEEAMMSVQFLAAGYELASGNDFTK